ncbi:hypothetical protein Pmani_030841 [Petrolisthes manimaculis]|uniref:Uncharacterized protein n=1 Tax=Petrolisthes manimaculis TaxID=1843537 RepID=A0AAE1NWB8_9EUCA|nr:hypothetical protein Pmani_030841 [Petrolisthes manimaculis]
MQQALERGQERVTGESTQLNIKTGACGGQSKSNLNTISKKTKPINSFGSYMKIEGVNLRDTEKSLSDLTLHQTSLHKTDANIGCTYTQETDVSVPCSPSTPLSKRSQKTQKYSYNVQKVKNSLNRDRSSSLPLISGVGTPGSTRNKTATHKISAGVEGKRAPLSPTLANNTSRTRKVTMSPKKSPKKSSPEKSRLPVKHHPDLLMHTAEPTQNSKEEKPLTKAFNSESTLSPTEKAKKLSHWSEVHLTKSPPETQGIGIEVKNKQQASRIPVPKNWNAWNGPPQTKNEASKATTNVSESKGTLQSQEPPKSCSSSNFTQDSVEETNGENQTSKIDNFQYRKYMSVDQLDSGSQQGEDPLVEVSFNNNTSEEGPSEKLLCEMIHTDSGELWTS